MLCVTAGCDLFQKDPVTHTTPPWPTAGPNVAEELDRIPFRGYSWLIPLREEAREIQKDPNAPLKYREFARRVETEIDTLQPEEGFEHLYEWLGRLYRLREQIEESRD